ncbi:MAG: FHA domain-containing protein [Propionibacteriales bacterium]|nr:FHA domain-containing protein [Propionibacteriales bacterium]
MSELTLGLIRFGYLALLWLFVLAAISVIRTDMFGARAAREASQAQERRAAKAAGKAKTKPVKTRRGDPTHVAVLDGTSRGLTVDLAGAPLLIGRGSDAAIRLDDDYVSTRHARIAQSGDQWYVEDLGSTNGTYIGPSRITQATAISLGTQIRIGKTIMELRK